jgi:prepilin-type N-terminal cleavage/methylation domain-containing protein
VALRSFLGNKGFSLLEVLIAVAILSGGIVIILQAVVFSGRLSRVSCDAVRGIFIAEDKMQELEFKTNNQIIAESSANSGRQDGFKWQYNISEDADKAGLYKMDLKVEWESAGREQNLELASWLLKR